MIAKKGKNKEAINAYGIYVVGKSGEEFLDYYETLEEAREAFDEMLPASIPESLQHAIYIANGKKPVRFSIDEVELYWDGNEWKFDELIEGDIEWEEFN